MMIITVCIRAVLVYTHTRGFIRNRSAPAGTNRVGYTFYGYGPGTVQSYGTGKTGIPALLAGIITNSGKKAI
jgi:hypothetical protein